MASNQQTTLPSIIQRKRFSNETKLINNQPIGYATAYPDTNDPFTWYFLIVGQKGTTYHGGHYIGVIKHANNYPNSAPTYTMLTPNGRFEPNKKICTSNSSFHNESWNSSWNILTILVAFNSMWHDDGDGGIAHIRQSNESRILMANSSIEWNQTNISEIYGGFDLSKLSFDVENDPRYRNGTYNPDV